MQGELLLADQFGNQLKNLPIEFFTGEFGRSRRIDAVIKGCLYPCVGSLQCFRATIQSGSGVDRRALPRRSIPRGS